MNTVEFGGLELVTSPLVMVPRATSRGLVARAAEHLAGRPGVVVDVGTGSGANRTCSRRGSPAGSGLGDRRQRGGGRARRPERPAGRPRRPDRRAARRLARSGSGNRRRDRRQPPLPPALRAPRASRPVRGATRRGLRRRRRAGHRPPPRRRRAPTARTRRAARPPGPGRIHSARAEELSTLDQVLAIAA